MTTPGDPKVAPLVGGRYQIRGLIAAGGMGEVYEARDTVLERTVALKLVRPSLGRDPGFLARFRSEATNAARLTHPAIVQVYDFGQETDGGAYMAMEYVDGQNLREILASRGRLEPGVAARIAGQVCDALDHAHRAGIVHRDVKPENILVSPDGRVKVADLGLSRALAEARATQAGTIIGSPHYLAPEQLDGSPADHRADLYALGVVLYEMLTGSAPFAGDTASAIAWRRIQQDVPPPSDIAPASAALDAIVRRATARSVDQRYPSAAEMGGALRAATVPGLADPGGLAHHTAVIPLEGQETVQLRPGATPPGGTPPGGTPPPGRRRARPQTLRRRRRTIGLVAVLALLAISIPLLVGALARAEVPRVAGMSRDRAERTLRAAGLTPTIDPRNHDTIPSGTVISSDPPAGRSVREGSVVRVVVSIGPATVGVPSVVGKTFAAAKAALEQRRLEVKRVDVFDSKVAKGRVISQDPEPSIQRVGSTVTLRVSKGVEMVEVPGVVGKSEQDARRALGDAGFTVATDRRYDDSKPEGEVLEQAPDAGTQAEKGSEVRIVVSRGPPRVKVPDIICLTPEKAATRVEEAGLEIQFVGAGRRVSDQTPAPGDEAPRGSTVTAFLGPGARC